MSHTKILIQFLLLCKTKKYISVCLSVCLIAQADVSELPLLMHRENYNSEYLKSYCSKNMHFSTHT